jgi:hypothetical protein
MAIVRYITFAKTATVKETETALRLNFKSHVSNLDVSQDVLDERIKICSKCANCFAGYSCKTIGTCRNSRVDFFTMHLNRKNGGCPTGQW